MTTPASTAAACPIEARPVPRIVLRTGQRIARGPLRMTPDGIEYADPRPSDWDAEGILWPRVTGPETGAPLYADINPLRQRAAMENPQRLLCQVGMGPATVTAHGVLWIIPQPTGAEAEPHPTSWPEGPTTEAPVCLAHAPVAARWCPRLRGQRYAAGFVREAPLIAVEGTLHVPARGVTGRTVPRAVFHFEEPATGSGSQRVDSRLLLAEHLVRELSGITPVDLRDTTPFRNAQPCNAGNSST